MNGTRKLSAIALALTTVAGVGLTGVETAQASPGDTPARVASHAHLSWWPDVSGVRHTRLYDEWTGRTDAGYYRFTRFTRLGTRVVNALWDTAERVDAGPQLLCAAIARPVPRPTRRCVRYVRAHRAHVNTVLNRAVRAHGSFEADTKLLGLASSPPYVFSAVRSVR